VAPSPNHGTIKSEWQRNGKFWAGAPPYAWYFWRFVAGKSSMLATIVTLHGVVFDILVGSENE
jgi:hypothetical protein